MKYRLNVAGLERELPLCPIGENLYIGAFILFGDVELTEKCAKALYEKAPEHDVMITAESKGIPLVHAMCVHMVLVKASYPFLSTALDKHTRKEYNSDTRHGRSTHNAKGESL